MNMTHSEGLRSRGVDLIAPARWQQVHPGGLVARHVVVRPLQTRPGAALRPGEFGTQITSPKGSQSC